MILSMLPSLSMASVTRLMSANGTFDTVRVYTTQLTTAETLADCVSAPGLDHLEVTTSSASGASSSSRRWSTSRPASA